MILNSQQWHRARTNPLSCYRRSWNHYLHKRRQTELSVSSLYILKLPVLGERVVNTRIKMGENRFRSHAATWSWGRTPGFGVTGSRMRRKWSRLGEKNTCPVKWQVEFGLFVLCTRVFVDSQYLIVVYVHPQSVLIPSGGSQQDAGWGISAHQDLTKWTDGFLWSALSAPRPLLPHHHHIPPSIRTLPATPSTTASCAQPL